ncbi:MAG: hypothetical protein U5L76_05845 [Patescibacteria group bacterium]|nr:hypothetical protein [Patescibacteria group bacterium]
MRLENKSDINPIKPEKKQKSKKWLWLVFGLIIILIPLVLIGLTGLYKIPGLSHIFSTAQAKDLKVNSSQEIRQNFLQKTGLKINLEANSHPFSQKEYKDQVSLSLQPTQEEITSLLQYSFPEDHPGRSLQVKMIEGGLELSAFLNKPLKVPVWTRVLVERKDDQTIELKIKKGKIGLIPVPEGYLEKAEAWLEKTINNRLAEIPNLAIKDLKYFDGYSYFEGTLPANITAKSGQWLDI